MSLYQFGAVIDGWNRANGSGKPDPLTDVEFEQMLAQSASGRAKELIGG